MGVWGLRSQRVQGRALGFGCLSSLNFALMGLCPWTPLGPSRLGVLWMTAQTPFLFRIWYRRHAS